MKQEKITEILQLQEELKSCVAKVANTIYLSKIDPSEYHFEGNEVEEIEFYNDQNGNALVRVCYSSYFRGEYEQHGSTFPVAYLDMADEEILADVRLKKQARLAKAEQDRELKKRMEEERKAKKERELYEELKAKYETTSLRKGGMMMG